MPWDGKESEKMDASHQQVLPETEDQRVHGSNNPLLETYWVKIVRMTKYRTQETRVAQWGGHQRKERNAGFYEGAITSLLNSTVRSLTLSCKEEGCVKRGNKPWEMFCCCTDGPRHGRGKTTVADVGEESCG